MDAPVEEVEKRVAAPPFEDTDVTPGWVRDFVYGEFPITFEPIFQRDAPLIQAWEGFSFAHPPHDEAQLWCEKAAAEAANQHFSVLLLPAVFNSIYWRTVVYPCATEIRVLACPIKKPGQKKQIVSQMALVVFADKAADHILPPVYIVEPENWEAVYYKRQRNLARFGVRK